MITKEQRLELLRLISHLVSASERLGGVDGSYGWNEAFGMQERAERALLGYLVDITEGS